MNWYKKSQLRYKDFLATTKGERWNTILSLGKIVGLTENQLEYLLNSKDGDEQALIEQLEEYAREKLVSKRGFPPSSPHRFPDNFELRLAK